MAKDRFEASYDDYCLCAVWRLSKTLENLPDDTTGTSVLDITSFATTQLIMLAYPDAHVYSCDRQLIWQPFLSENIECSSFDLIEDDRPYADGQFDAIVLTEVLEHIPRSPYEVLHELKRSLRPEGTLLISVPKLHSVDVADPANVNSSDPEIVSLSSTFSHFREYTAPELEQILSEIGFEVEPISFPRWYSRKFHSRVGRRNLCRNRFAAGYMAIDAVNPRWRTTISGITTKPAS